MRIHYTRKLDEIEALMLDMSDKALKSVTNTKESLNNRDILLAEKIIKNDHIINNLEYEIEHEINKLIPLEKPVAKDFRKIASIFKIITDLERIGDLSVNIAKIVIELSNEEFVKPLDDIYKMFNEVIKSFNESMEAYKTSDIKLATRVAEKDDIIDNLQLKVIQDILDLTAKNGKIIDQALKLMLISRYLERMGDHITNICERIIYIDTNSLITHKF